MRTVKKSIVASLLIVIGLTLFYFYHANYSSFDAFGSTKSKSGSSALKKVPSKSVTIKAAAAIVIDLSDGKTLYSKNIHKRLYPASLTKLMTALLLTEKDKPEDMLTYTTDAEAQPSNKLYFTDGATLTAENAMHGMLIFSANDMATMVADNLSSSSDYFVTLMNKKAKKLNMNDTHFANANGLQNKNHYSTAYDISLLARTVYKNAWIMNCLETPSATVSTTDGKSYTIVNTNKTLDKNGCFAGKTGFTTPAGYCLAAYYKKGGKTLVGIVLKSPTDVSLYTDMNAIINQSAAAHK